MKRQRHRSGSFPRRRFLGALGAASLASGGSMFLGTKAASKLGVPLDPEDALNSRTPAFDLDSVYGGGPGRSPELYGRGRDSIKFRVESGGQFEDLPRRSNGTAITCATTRT